METYFTRILPTMPLFGIVIPEVSFERTNSIKRITFRAIWCSNTTFHGPAQRLCIYADRNHNRHLDPTIMTICYYFNTQWKICFFFEATFSVCRGLTAFVLSVLFWYMDQDDDCDSYQHKYTISVLDHEMFGLNNISSFKNILKIFLQ
jgi:hypothetical protein